MASIFILTIILCLTISYNSFVSACGTVPGAVPIVMGPTGGGKKCFYVEADVNMANGRKKKIKDLQIGDEVLAYNLEKGVHPSRIFGELYDDHETTVQIYEIETNSGRKIPVTAEHSLFVRRCLTDDRKWSPKSAQQIQIGDCVPRFHTIDGGEVIEEAVTKIRVFDAIGIRQPVTETGTIIVDDVVVSCYDRVVNQDATHMALFPYRWFTNLRQNYMSQLKSLLPSVFDWFGFFETSLV